MKYDVVVLGAGAAGLMAAITAASRKKSVLVIERSNKVGKKIGGDILENKKTVLFHTAIENSNESQKEKILELYSSKENLSGDKINKITSLFIETKADKSSLDLVDQYTQKAIKLINCLSFDQTKKNDFINFSNSLMKRDL